MGMRYMYQLCYMHLLVVVVLFGSRAAGTITARVYCDDRATVYADGEKKTEDDKEWSGDIAEDTKVLAVACRNTGGFGGLLVSVGDVLISDPTWKCTETVHAGWYEPNFNDETWSSAYVLGDNSGEENSGVDKSKQSNYNKYAKWIWVDENNTDEETIYCRGRTGLIIHARCNDRCEVYVDGKHYGNTESHWQVLTNTIPKTSRLIAIAGKNAAGGHGMIVAKVVNGFSSSREWMCSEGLPGSTDWTTIGYEDMDWTPAVHQKHSTGGEIEIRWPFGEAIPIWYEVSPNALEWSRCRGQLECGCENRCQVDGGEFVCLCDEGYTLRSDKRRCRDINECTETADNEDTPLHDCEQGCINHIGTYECECDNGFTLDDDERHCNDIDECITRADRCSDPFLCENSIGSYECVCPTGYENDGGMCNNIDECADNTDDCRQECKDEPGSYSCQCYNGYVSDTANSNTFTDVDECQTGAHNCSGLFECNNTQGGFDCLCKDGYTLKDEKCIDVNECDQSNMTCEHTCDNTDGSFTCSCRKGFALQSDATACAPQSKN